MNRRRFLQGLFYGAVTALLMAPKVVLERFLSPPAPSERFYHFAHTWDGDTRRTWIDGEEVFSGGAVIDADTGLLGEWEATYMLPSDVPSSVTITDRFYQVVGSDQGSISFWVIPPVRFGPSDGISWTRLSDDSPFEPPQRTDPPAVVDSDIGEGEALVDSW